MKGIWRNMLVGFMLRVNGISIGSVLLLFLIFYLIPVCACSQNNVSWRNEATNGNWEGGTTCDSWGTDGNWLWNTGGNRNRPDCFAARNIIHFSNGNQPVMNLNSALDYTANQIQFDLGTTERTIGSDISRTLYFKQYPGNNAKIQNNVSYSHVFNLNINIEESGTWMEFRPESGSLIFNNPIINNSGNTIHIFGNHQVTFFGNLSSTAGTPGVTVNGNATAVYDGVPKTYSGTTSINSGATLKISSDQSLGNIVLNAGGNLVVDAGSTLTITGTWTGGGTLANNGNIVLDGPSAFPGAGTTISSMANLIIQNNVTLDQSLTVSDMLILSGGIITTSSANMLSISSTSQYAIVGGSSSSYINGPVQWTLEPNMWSGSPYHILIGKGGVYMPMSLVDPSTGAGTTTITAEAFNENAGGTFGASLTSLSSTEYWSLASSGNLINHKLSLTRQSSVAPFNRIGISTTKTGVYTSVGGIPSANSIINSDPVAAGASQYFVFGTALPPALQLFYQLQPYNDVCLNDSKIESCEVIGTNLTADPVNMAELAGFTYCLDTDAGPYTSTLVLPNSGATNTWIIYVKFTPVLVQIYSGNIVVSGGGAPSLNVPASGNGLALPLTSPIYH